VAEARRAKRVPALGLETQYTEDRPDWKSLERCSVGITACDALIGQTGSILLTARSAQLVPDLPAAFEAEITWSTVKRLTDNDMIEEVDLQKPGSFGSPGTGGITR